MCLCVSLQVLVAAYDLVYTHVSVSVDGVDRVCG